MEMFSQPNDWTWFGMCCAFGSCLITIGIWLATRFIGIMDKLSDNDAKQDTRIAVQDNRLDAHEYEIRRLKNDPNQLPFVYYKEKTKWKDS